MLQGGDPTGTGKGGRIFFISEDTCTTYVRTQHGSGPLSTTASELMISSSYVRALLLYVIGHILNSYLQGRAFMASTFRTRLWKSSSSLLVALWAWPTKDQVRENVDQSLDITPQCRRFCQYTVLTRCNEAYQPTRLFTECSPFITRRYEWLAVFHRLHEIATFEYEIPDSG